MNDEILDVLSLVRREFGNTLPNEVIISPVNYFIEPDNINEKWENVVRVIKKIVYEVLDSKEEISTKISIKNIDCRHSKCYCWEKESVSEYEKKIDNAGWARLASRIKWNATKALVRRACREALDKLRATR